MIQKKNLEIHIKDLLLIYRRRILFDPRPKDLRPQLPVQKSRDASLEASIVIDRHLRVQIFLPAVDESVVLVGSGDEGAGQQLGIGRLGVVVRPGARCRSARARTGANGIILKSVRRWESGVEGGRSKNVGALLLNSIRALTKPIVKLIPDRVNGSPQI